MGEQNYASKHVMVSSSLDASGANAVTIGPPGYPMEVSQVRLMCSVASTGSSAVLTVTKNINTGSATNDIDLCTITVPSGYAIGDEILVDVHAITDINLNSGEQLVFTSGGESDAGTFYISVIGNYVNPGPNPAKAFTETTRKGFENGTGTYNYLAAVEI